MDVKPAAFDILTISKLHGSFKADIQIRSDSIGTIEFSINVNAARFEEVPLLINEALATFAGELIGATAQSR